MRAVVSHKIGVKYRYTTSILLLVLFLRSLGGYGLVGFNRLDDPIGGLQRLQFLNEAVRNTGRIALDQGMFRANLAAFRFDAVDMLLNLRIICRVLVNNDVTLGHGR